MLVCQLKLTLERRPLIDFSSTNVLYFEGNIEAGASDNAMEWQTVRVVLAELTSETCAYLNLSVLAFVLT